MARRVMVTRPEPGASATAARLREMGLEAVVLPLTRIEPLAGTVKNAASFDGVVLTSANAVRIASPDLLVVMRELPCHAVGPATGEAARLAGLKVVLESRGDAASLSEDIISRLPHGSRLLYPCGRVRSPSLEDALGDAGIDVTPLEVYDAVAVGYPSSAIREAVADRPLDLALIHSRRGGELLAGIMSRSELGDLFAGTMILSISAKAAAQLANRHVEVAAEPSEPALLALVKAKV